MRYLNSVKYPPLLANRSAVYGLLNSEGYLANKLNVPREHQELLLRLGGQTTALNLFSTKYVLLRENQPPGALVPVFREGDVIVCENPAPAARAFFMTHVRSVDDAGEAISLMRNAAFDPRTTGLVCGTGRSLDETYPPVGDEERCAVAERRPGEVSIDVQCNVRRWLFIGSSFDSGWKAMLDGQPVNLYRTNACFMSLEVPPGRHSIRLAYTTPGLALGLAISAVTLIVLIAAAGLWCAFGPTRDSRQSP
jgi:hypothetical protein